MDTNERHLMDLLSLKDRVAIVTGACGWLGAAMSRGLAEAGARLVVTSREGVKRRAIGRNAPRRWSPWTWI